MLLIILSSGSRLFNCQRDLQRSRGKNPKAKGNNERKPEMRSRTVQPSGRFPCPQTEPRAKGSWRQPKCSCSAGLWSEFKHRGLTHIASSALQHRPGNSTSQWQKKKKLPGNSFATSDHGAVVGEQLALILQGYKNTAGPFVLRGEGF